MNDLRLIFRYGKPYRRDLWAAAGLIFIECIFEMVIPVLMSTLVDEGVPSHNMAIILRQGGLMALCAVLALITGLLYARYAARFANGFAAELRLAEYAAVQKFDFANLDHFSSASLVTRMTTDATVLLNAINAGLRPFVRSPVMLAMGLGMAFLLSPKLTIVFLITTPILTILLTLIVRKVGPLYGRQQSAVDHLNSRIQESLTAIRAIKAFVRGDYENEQFNAVNTELSDASTETFRYAVLNLPAFQTIMYTAIVCIMWFGGGFILQGDMSVGQLTAFLSYVLQVLNSVMMFSGAFLQMTRSLASARRIREVLTEQPDLANAAEPVDTVQNGQIDFEGVSFKYNAAAQKSALSDITLHIPAGATVGIIGGTGSAKTTLVQLIPRLYDATEGTVKVGGRDVRDYDLTALRDAVGIVLQKNLLFSGTIRDNLKWGNPDAAEEQLWAACRAAHADEFLDRMPDGLDTDLGPGRRQRLRRAEAAPLHCPYPAEAPEGADFRRLHQRRGYCHRVRYPPRPGRTDRRDQADHCPAHLLGAERRPHRDLGGWPPARRGHPRRTAGKRYDLSGNLLFPDEGRRPRWRVKRKSPAASARRICAARWDSSAPIWAATAS